MLVSTFPSLPLWKCGLKSIGTTALGLDAGVTSLVEVWIEIGKTRGFVMPNVVTSLVEVWIEILKN